MKPIGVIHTPYTDVAGMPIQGVFDRSVTATATVWPEYEEGLKDIQGFSHLILIYYFNRSKTTVCVGTPFLENKPHGIFAIRGPHRPNHIGFSVVQCENVSGRTLTFSEVDMLDGTPLLDIKPYVSAFDVYEVEKSGRTENKTDSLHKRKSDKRFD